MNKISMRMALLATALAIAGCGPKPDIAAESPKQSSAAPTPASPPTPKLSKTEWRAAFRSTFEELKSSSDGDGITSYVACFDKGSDGKCAMGASGKRDAFRKLDHLTPFLTVLNRIGRLAPHVPIYITAIECKAPVLLVAPSINRKGGWLFMEKVAFMADGEVTLEHSFENSQVDRDVEGSWIHEDGTFVLTAADLDGLEKFVSGKEHVIRITGQKGYMTIEKAKTADFLKDAKTSLEMLKRISGALENAGGPECSAEVQPS